MHVYVILLQPWSTCLGLKYSETLNSDKKAVDNAYSGITCRNFCGVYMYQVCIKKITLVP